MDEVGGCLVEEREELMVSPMGSSTPTLRKAHFLKPPQVPGFTLSGSTSLPQPSHVVVPSKVRFTAWGFHKLDWEEWVKHLEPKYCNDWKKAGIYSGIIGSTTTCVRDLELIMGLAEKWCSETNSFLFPWGEATLTLEDVAILGGYSVLGSPVFPRSKVKKPAEVKLAKAMKEVAKGAANYVNRGDWIREFKDSGSDIEHEAFLSMWLHPILFCDSSQRIRIHQFYLARRLANGERLALAPAVLAGIYRDLSLLKSSGRWDHSKRLFLNSQIHFVQLWAWERFPAFQPLRNCIEVGDPRSFMWDNVQPMKVADVRLTLDSAGETFCWRPYTIGINGWQLPRFYRDKEGFHNLESDSELQIFALFLRVSKLVGLDFVQNYFPHRVGLQFGLDQDVPSNFVVEEESLEDAWRNYMRPFEATEMYMPSRLFEADLTLKYFEWWKEQAISFAAGGPPRLLDDVLHKVVRRKRTSMKRLKMVHGTVLIANADNTGDANRGYSLNCNIINIEDSDEDDKPEVERKVCGVNATSGNDLSLADQDGRRCTNGGMKSTSGEVGESARASGQVGTSARMACHVSVKKNYNPLHCRDNSKGTEGNNRHVCDANIINIEDIDEDDKLEVDMRVRDANTTSGNNLSMADRDGRLRNKGCSNGRIESTPGGMGESVCLIGQIGASAGAVDHVIVEKNDNHLDCHDNSNGIAEENGDNLTEVLEVEINAYIARAERDLAKIKSIVASKIQGKKD